MTIIPIAKMANTILTIQSSSPMEIAAKNQTRLFIVYVVILVLGSLLATFLTILVYRASNAYQEAVKADADARIAEANQKAAEANKRAAEAQTELAKIQARFIRRTLTQVERDKMVALLHAYLVLAKEAKEKRGESFVIVHPTADNEATEYANLLFHMFRNAEWSTTVQAVPYALHQTGISIVVKDANDLPMYAQVVKNALKEMKIPATIREEKNIDNKTTFLEIGSKD